jgi:hypothetical protein
MVLLLAGAGILLTARDYYVAALPAYERQAEFAAGLGAGALSRWAVAYCRHGALLDTALGCFVGLVAIGFGTASLV